MELLDLLVPDEVPHRVDHSPDFGAIFLDDHVADPLQAKRSQGVPLVLLGPDLRTYLGHLEPCHHRTAASARAASMAAGATSSTGRPRRAATASGDSSIF